MIANIDIIYEVSKYLDNTDSLAYVTPNAYRLPYDTLCRIGLATNFVAADPQCLEDFPTVILKTPVRRAENLVRAHTAPEKIADVALRYELGANREAVVNGLLTNPNWTSVEDDRLLAIRFLGAVYSNNAIDEEILTVIYDDKVMKRLCRFDQVLKEYAGFLWSPLENVMSYSHGRKIGEMYRLLCDIPDNVKVLFNECATLADLEGFLDAIADEKGDVLPYLSHPLITHDALDGFVGKYN